MNLKKANIKLIYTVLGSISLIALAIGIFLVVRSNNQEPVASSSISENYNNKVNNRQNCLGEDCLGVDVEYPAGSLPPEVKKALDRALDDEYKARATYEAVINELGNIRPFIMIIRAEEQHISSLKSIYDKYGIAIPEDPYSSIEVGNTKMANCQVGVQAEIDNAKLYKEELLPLVQDYPDIVSVFTKLMNASQKNHLPAFQNCAI